MNLNFEMAYSSSKLKEQPVMFSDGFIFWYLKYVF